ncbi:HlyD family efflux transporter periplasmic adaptor subunit [soil metagenome]
MSFWCSIAIAARLFGCEPEYSAFAGYVEGEFSAIAPVEVARVAQVNVRRGDHVLAGTLIANLEDSDAVLALRQAEAKFAQMRAQLANLKSGRRREEIAVIAATLESAKANERDAQLAFDRKRELYERRVNAKADLDQAQAALDIAHARVKEIEANLAVAALPARPDEIAAMEQQTAEAEAALGTARWHLDERRVIVHSGGLVFDILKRPGETAGPSAPVISFLPDGAIKLRFYIPQGVRSSVTAGTKLTISCDGCQAGLTAAVTYVADHPEFTPPVIYSVENRQKLVYLVEARPDNPSSPLNPGQIVDVHLVNQPKP